MSKEVHVPRWQKVLRGTLTASLLSLPCLLPSKPIHAQTPQLPAKDQSVPRALNANYRLAFERLDVQGTNIYISGNAEPEARVTNTSLNTDPRWLNKSQIAFRSMDKFDGRSKLKIYDVEAQKVIYEGSSNEDFCPEPLSSGQVLVTRGSTYLEMVAVDPQKNTEVKVDMTFPEARCPRISKSGNIALNQVSNILLFQNKAQFPNIKPENVIKIPGGTILSWNKEGDKLLVLREEEQRIGTKIFLYEVKITGLERKVAEGALGADWLEDGSIVYSKLAEDQRQGKTEYWIITPEGRHEKIATVSYLVKNIAASRGEFLENAKRVVIFVPGMISEISEGHHKSDIFEPLQARLASVGFKKEDMVLFSLTGWSFDENGRYKPHDQKCTETLKGADWSSDVFLTFLKDWKNKNPDKKTTIITHSFGSVIVFDAISKVKKGQFYVDLDSVDIIMTHGPLHGVDKPLSDWLGAQFSVDMPTECQSLFDPLPSPGVVNYPTFVDLKNRWNNRVQLGQEMADTAIWFQKKGGKITSIFNYQDGAISLTAHLMPEWVLRRLIFISLDDAQDMMPALSPRVHGIDNQGDFLGTRDFGHSQVLRQDPGLSRVTSRIGKQNS